MTSTKYTSFFDMCSGGDRKTPYSVIIFPGGYAEAVARFREEFERDPENVTCDCCGSDYCIETHDTLEEARRAYGHCVSRYIWEDNP